MPGIPIQPAQGVQGSSLSCWLGGLGARLEGSHSESRGYGIGSPSLWGQHSPVTLPPQQTGTVALNPCRGQPLSLTWPQFHCLVNEMICKALFSPKAHQVSDNHPMEDFLCLQAVEATPWPRGLA